MVMVMKKKHFGLFPGMSRSRTPGLPSSGYSFQWTYVNPPHLHPFPIPIPIPTLPPSLFHPHSHPHHPTSPFPHPNPHLTFGAQNRPTTLRPPRVPISPPRRLLPATAPLLPHPRNHPSPESKAWAQSHSQLSPKPTTTSTSSKADSTGAGASSSYPGPPFRPPTPPHSVSLFPLSPLFPPERAIPLQTPIPLSNISSPGAELRARHSLGPEPSSPPRALSDAGYVWEGGQRRSAPKLQREGGADYHVVRSRGVERRYTIGENVGEGILRDAAAASFVPRPAVDDVRYRERNSLKTQLRSLPPSLLASPESQRAAAAASRHVHGSYNWILPRVPPAPVPTLPPQTSLLPQYSNPSRTQIRVPSPPPSMVRLDGAPPVSLLPPLPPRRLRPRSPSWRRR